MYREAYEDGESGEGPHGVHPGSRGDIVKSNTICTASPVDPLDCVVAETYTEDDAEFYLHAHSDVPTLAAAVEQLADALEAAKGGWDRLAAVTERLRTQRALDREARRKSPALRPQSQADCSEPAVEANVLAITRAEAELFRAALGHLPDFAGEEQAAMLAKLRTFLAGGAPS
jgi:hypothetical protein